MRQINYKTPRLLVADAYTVSSELFESNTAREYSSYAISFRRQTPNATPGDQRILFCGLQQIIDDILREPITYSEIGAAEEFLKSRRATNLGLANYHFPKELWLKILHDYDGRIPIIIEAVPEGSTVYPGEVVVRVYSPIPGFGPICAWFESKLLHVWATSERLTMTRHMLDYQRDMIRRIETQSGNLLVSDDKINFLASIRVHDFGDRAAICSQESERLGMVHLYCFGGTDTFAGAYQAFCNGSGAGVGVSVYAQAHRTVGGYLPHHKAYRALYDEAQNGDIISQVADLVDYKTDVENYLLPLALESFKDNRNITIVARPDSGDVVEQVLWTIDLIEKNNLYYVEVNGYKYGLNLKIICGDSITQEKIEEIDRLLIERGWAPHGVLIYGVGGYLRNNLKRDNLSAKYYLYEVGNNNEPVVKLSNTVGKRSLPACKIVRDTEAVSSGITIRAMYEEGTDILVEYYNGLTQSVYMDGMNDDFTTIQNRVLNDFEKMPKTGGTPSSELNDWYKNIVQENFGITL